MADRSAVFCLWVFDRNRIFLTIHFLQHQQRGSTIPLMQIAHLPLSALTSYAKNP